MSSSIKLYLLGFIFFIIILIAVFFAGKGFEEKPPKNEELPNDFNRDNQLTEFDKLLVKQITENLYKDISSNNFFGHEHEPFEKLLSVSNTLFVAVWNEWKNLHWTELGSFREALEKESDLTDYTFNSYRNSIISKMNTLNLQ